MTPLTQSRLFQPVPQGPPGLMHTLEAEDGAGREAVRLLTPHFRVARVEAGRLRPARRLRAKQRPRRLARPRTPPFHGDNTGSNPVGDANKTNNLSSFTHFCCGAFWGAVKCLF